MVLLFQGSYGTLFYGSSEVSWGVRFAVTLSAIPFFQTRCLKLCSGSAGQDSSAAGFQRAEREPPHLQQGACHGAGQGELSVSHHYIIGYVLHHYYIIGYAVLMLHHHYLICYDVVMLHLGYDVLMLHHHYIIGCGALMLHRNYITGYNVDFTELSISPCFSGVAKTADCREELSKVVQEGPEVSKQPISCTKQEGKIEGEGVASFLGSTLRLFRTLYGDSFILLFSSLQFEPNL